MLNHTICQRTTKVKLQGEEAEILLRLRTGNFTEIIIELKNGKVKRLKLSEEVSEKKLVELLKEHDFQDIQLTQRDGNIISVKRTIIDKL